MDNKKKRKLGFMVLVFYIIICMSPYFVDGLNQISPKLFGIPFTIWSIMIVVTGFCIFLYYMSKNVWYHYDDEIAEEVENSNKINKKKGE